ncbi:MAG: glycosyltransferase [Thermoplasmata archaeon]|nr:glycosyltransferase [Thermoplasmata archaeon]
MSSLLSPPADGSSLANPGGDQRRAVASTTLSVLVPVYNGERSVRGAVASVASQLPAPVEILIIDDGSTDGSGSLLTEIARSIPSVRLLQNESNTGLASTLNQGLRAAKGELVLVLHQDCALLGDDWLVRGASHFRDPSVITAVGSPLHLVERMDPLEREFWVLRNHTADPSGGEPAGDRLTLFSENKCDLFRRELLLELGGFDTRLEEGGEDQVLAWKLRQSRYRVVHDPSLRFTILLGAAGGLRTHLKKDASYGRQMRQVLSATRFGALRHAPGSSVDPRFVNRVSGVLWILFALAGLGLFLVTRAPLALLVVGVPPLARWVQLTLRGVRARQTYQLGGRELATIGGVGWLADLSYALGFLVPKRHPRRRESPRAAA